MEYSEEGDSVVWDDMLCAKCGICILTMLHIL